MDSIPVVRADFTRTCQPTNVELMRSGGGGFNSMRDREGEKNNRIQQNYIQGHH